MEEGFTLRGMTVARLRAKFLELSSSLKSFVSYSYGLPWLRGTVNYYLFKPPSTILIVSPMSCPADAECHG